MKRIRVLIADDNKQICQFIKKSIEGYSEIEILGMTYTDEEEVAMIEQLKPDIVITDLVRNGKYSGLDIIKDYYKKENSPKFLVISADRKEYVIDKDLEVAGYIEKGRGFDFNLIINEIRKIIQKGEI